MRIDGHVFELRIPSKNIISPQFEDHLVCYKWLRENHNIDISKHAPGYEVEVRLVKKTEQQLLQE